jgi:hypothetical protein
MLRLRKKTNAVYGRYFCQFRHLRERDIFIRMDHAKSYVDTYSARYSSFAVTDNFFVEPICRGFDRLIYLSRRSITNQSSFYHQVPESPRRGKKHRGLVETLDILPTIMDYLGIEWTDVSEEMQDTSLLRLTRPHISSHQEPDRPHFLFLLHHILLTCAPE